MDYKDTLHMPNTGFEMRGNLANKEPGILDKWQKQDYYKRILEKNEGNKPLSYMMAHLMLMVIYMLVLP